VTTDQSLYRSRSTLRVLDYADYDHNTEKWSAALAAFTLRNMRLLQIFGYATSRGGIEMFHHQQQQDNFFQGIYSVSQLSFTSF